MSNPTDKAMRKLRKFRRDPTLFLYDYFRKRLVSDIEPTPAGTTGHVVIALDDVRVGPGEVVITNPQVVEQVRRLQNGSAPAGRRLTLSWWT